jgi:hypothetical protein
MLNAYAGSAAFEGDDAGKAQGAICPAPWELAFKDL